MDGLERTNVFLATGETELESTGEYYGLVSNFTFDAVYPNSVFLTLQNTDTELTEFAGFNITTNVIAPTPPVVLPEVNVTQDEASRSVIHKASDIQDSYFDP